MIRASLAALLLLAAPGLARQAAARSGEAVSVEKMRPGQFAWFDEQAVRSDAAFDPAAAGSVSMVVSLPEQKAYVYRDGLLIGISTVSTGAKGHETPVGEFTILEKKSFHRSNLYSDAPMPFMQRLTWDGIALHSGKLPGYPASHGCIRLPDAFAKKLFTLTARGGSVSVVDTEVGDLPLELPPLPALAAETRNLGGGSYDTLTMGGEGPEDLLPARTRAESAGRTRTAAAN